MMYTVMRVTGRPEQIEMARDIHAAIVHIRPDANAEQRRRDGVVVCDVAKEASWQEHQTAIVRFINDCSVPIESATAHGMNVTVDVAIDSEDVAGRPYLCVHCDLELVKVLAEHRVELEFTMYA